MYAIEYAEGVLSDIALLKRSDAQAFRKLAKLLIELAEHPTTGTGKVEPLKYGLSGLWSRRISDKHRLIYEVIEGGCVVIVISVRGHYYDK